MFNRKKRMIEALAQKCADWEQACKKLQTLHQEANTIAAGAIKDLGYANRVAQYWRSLDGSLDSMSRPMVELRESLNLAPADKASLYKPLSADDNLHMPGSEASEAADTLRRGFVPTFTPIGGPSK